jgi:chromosome segregation protein
MRLSAIKLAGFKSFVDPTVLNIHSNLTGVVGPNGCGKSNIIDAVRWVLGEMSTKQLRGAESEDVIFNGSRDRKPVGRASIEILFDNGEGRFGDRYSSFSEISIKRELSRDGTSSYFLNGARCRRRDIVDLFLGTGVAGRDNYAIIQQGTVSRFVEAKPDELRLILEEAAGISKYKERRRETENRIKHTRENLARLNDLRTELIQRLETLKKQSANAEKFKEYKQQERKLKAELLVVRWRTLGAEAEQQEQGFSQAQGELNSRQERLRAVEQAREQQRLTQQEAGHAVQNLQGEFYSAEAEVARVEQALRHALELKESRARELASIEQQQVQLDQRIQAEQSRRDGLSQELAGLDQAIQTAETAETEVRSRFNAADHELQEAATRWESFTHEAQEPLSQAEGERARVEQMQQQLATVSERIRKLEMERGGLSDQPLQDALNSAAQALSGLNTELEQGQAELTGLERQLVSLRDQRAELDGALHEARQALQSARGRLASLEALQQAALREDDDTLRQWLQNSGWTSPKRLAQQLEVEAGWEKAVEAALGSFLQALCVDNLDARLSELKGWPKVPVTLFDAVTTSVPTSGALCVDHSLATRVKGPAAVVALLSTVYAVDSETEAAKLRERLQPGQTLVTRGGLCFGPGWVQHPRGEFDEIGVIGREQALKSLKQEITALEQRTRDLEARVDSLREQLKEQEARRQSRGGALEQLRKQHADALSLRQSQSLKLEQVQGRARAIEAEITDLRAQQSRQQTELEAAGARLQQLQQTAEQLTSQRQALQEQMRVLRQAVAEVQQAREQAAEQRQSLQVQIAGRRSALQATESGLTELAGRIDSLRGQQVELTRLLAESNVPMEQHDAARLAAQGKRQTAQAALEDARRRLTAVEAEADGLAQQAQEAESAVEAVREAAQQARLAHQTISVRRQTLVEQINESGNTVEALSADLPETATPEQWEEQLGTMDRRIQRLGPINLAAIGEYEEHQQRETYLTVQYTDLTEALTQLEDAIHKIDRETKSRFKETFDKVDDIFRQTFPKLFGGGEAYLELMGEDLLETGVRVMARPPGKRNSVIQQLSGGEKALTAVALLFALFELNPAPFCLLDEVDAPLDDNNVGRFCELVREMSERVQFIVITHNKITMEMAHHLHGVTMQEPGVSRLVSVDMDQAVALAEAG